MTSNEIEANVILARMLASEISAVSTDLELLLRAAKMICRDNAVLPALTHAVEQVERECQFLRPLVSRTVHIFAEASAEAAIRKVRGQSQGS